MALVRLPPVLAVLAALAVMSLWAPPVEASGVDGPRSFVLALDEPAFWEGPPSTPGDCGTDCWAYGVEVAEEGHRLRIGIDRPRIGDVWRARILRPNGTLAATISPGVNLYSAEFTEADPATGMWAVHVTAQDVDERRVRLRAGLDADDLLPDGNVDVPPDLQPMPPWEFSFRLPVSNGLVGGEGVGVALPLGRIACHPEEVALYAAVRCLRMSFGVANTGPGPLQLQLGGGTFGLDRPLIQEVRTAEGDAWKREAGNAYYHHSHAHYHHDDAIGLELLRVVDVATGELEAAGEPLRKGFAHRNELLRDWETFYPRWEQVGFGLVPGWADYYEWDRPGNYIDLGLNADGLYVVRMTADPDGHILDANPDNNVAYSLIEVAGATVEHLESGRGTDPWDPCRTPLPLGTDFEDSFTLDEPRPSSCPPL